VCKNINEGKTTQLFKAGGKPVLNETPGGVEGTSRLGKM
jgi:hypothetical protein